MGPILILSPALEVRAGAVLSSGKGLPVQPIPQPAKNKSVSLQAVKKNSIQKTATKLFIFIFLIPRHLVRKNRFLHRRVYAPFLLLVD